jgi:hypothetical protein
MRGTDLQRAVNAAVATASSAGLRVGEANIIHESNRIAVRLLPCDVLARVAHHMYRAGADIEVDVAHRLAVLGAPLAAPDPRFEPRVHLHDDMAITFWAYYETDAAPVAPPDYAHALARLHAGMRQIDVEAPHFTDRVAEARAILADRARSPELDDADRHLLVNTLQQMTAAITKRGAPEQLLHGEPHPGNLLHTKLGPLFTDFETCCRGPVEFDLAHAPADVAEHYPGVVDALLDVCRIVMLAMIIAWRWEPDDELPDGRALATEWLAQLRTALAEYDTL